MSPHHGDSYGLATARTLNNNNNNNNNFIELCASQSLRFWKVISLHLEFLKSARNCRSSAGSKISRNADLPSSPGLHSIIGVAAVVVFIVGSERLGIGVADRGGFNFCRLLSLFFFAVDFLPKENLSKFCSDGSDILCKFMDVRNQECDLDLISTVVNFCQGQDVWWVDGGIVFLATILVYDGLEWSRQPNLNVGNWKRRIGFALWLVFGARARCFGHIVSSCYSCRWREFIE